MTEDYTPQWSSEKRFNLALLSYTLGIVNIKSGPVQVLAMRTRAAATIPLVIVMVTMTIPIVFLELALGQYSNKSPIGVWDLCPLFRGVGYSSVLIFALLQTYYTTLCTYALYYILAGVNYHQDMKTCNSGWSAVNCTQQTYTLNFDHKAQEMGTPQLSLALFGLIPPIVIFFANSAGPKSIDRLTVAFQVIPAISLVVIFFVTFIDPGGMMGLIFILTVDFTGMSTWDEWSHCITSSLYSVGVGMSAYIALGTYCPFRNALYLKSIAVAGFDNFLTLMSTFVVINVIGALSFHNKVPVEEITGKGEALLFSGVPEGLQVLPWAPQAWIVITYLTVFLMGLRSQIVMVCLCTNYILRAAPSSRRHPVLTGFACCFAIYGSSLLLFTRIGYQTVTMVERTLTLYTLPFLVSTQLVGVMYVYGMRNFMEDVHFMIGIRPPAYWKISYLASPLVMAAIFFHNLVKFLRGGRQFASTLVYFLQVAIIATPIVITVTVAVFNVVTQGVAKSLRPSREWGPAEPTLRKSRQMFKTHNMTKEYMYRQEILAKTDR